jgi:hypothetical protein
MVIKAMLRGLLTIEKLNLLFLRVKGTLRRALHALDMPIGPDCDGIQPTRLGEEALFETTVSVIPAKLSAIPTACDALSSAPTYRDLTTSPGQLSPGAASPSLALVHRIRKLHFPLKSVSSLTITII